MKKLVKLLPIVLILIIATPVLAYTYSVTITVHEDGGNSYTNLPMYVVCDNEQLVDYDFMSDTGLNTRVTTISGTELPHMVADNATYFIADINANSTSNFLYLLGETAMNFFKIILGIGGYITVDDDAALELADNFNIKEDGHLDTSFDGVEGISEIVLYHTISGISHFDFDVYYDGGWHDYWQGVDAASPQTVDNGTITESVEAIRIRGKHDGGGPATWKINEVIPDIGVIMNHGGVDWADEENAYDGDTTSYAEESNPPTGGAWGDWLELELGDPIIHKTGAILVGIPEAENITAMMYGVGEVSVGDIEDSYTNLEVNADGTNFDIAVGASDRFTYGDDALDPLINPGYYLAQTWTATENYTMQSIGLKIGRYAGHTPGDINVYLYETSGGKPTGSPVMSTTFDGDAIPTGAKWKYDIPFNDSYEIESGTKYAIAMMDADASVSHYVYWQKDTSSPTYSGGSRFYSSDGSTWTEDTTDDFMFIISQYEEAHFNSMVLSDNVTNTSNDYLIYSKFTYIDNFSIDVDGAEELYLVSNSMIIGTALPDLQSSGGDNDGVITWGSMVPGVSTSMSHMTSYDQPAPGISTTGATPIDIVPEANIPNPSLPATSTELQNNPLYPVVHFLANLPSISSNYSEAQIWVGLATFIILLFMVGAWRAAPGHLAFMGIAGMVGCVIAWQMSIYPYWTLIIFGFVLIGSLVSERKIAL